jgi:hypothetical protein
MAADRGKASGYSYIGNVRKGMRAGLMVLEPGKAYTVHYTHVKTANGVSFMESWGRTSFGEENPEEDTQVFAINYS